jgi:hypothetical protein
MSTAYLEESDEVVEPFLLRAAIEAHAACVEEDANKAYTKEVIRHVNGTGLERHGMAFGCQCI